MKQNNRQLALVAVLCFVSFTVISRWMTVSSSIPLAPTTSLLEAFSSHHKECSFVERHADQCAFVEKNCKGFSQLFLRFYYCSEIWKPISLSVMILGLLLLFGAVSVVASDFFCPNLQTISSKLQLSESMAGVTILAFGNGSPDLFSTFSALENGAGSLAIGELIGAAFFIVSVVSGSMGIIRPFQSKRITFMRDASFLTGAIMMLTWIVYHRRIYWYHGVALIAYYLTYVFVVVFGAYRFPGAETPAKLEHKSLANSLHSGVDEQLTETSRLLPHENGSRGQPPPRLAIPAHGFASQHSISSFESHLGHVIRPISPNSSHRSSLHLEGLHVPRTTSTNGSISSRLYRHAMTPRIGIRTSLFSAIEFQEQITTIRRTGSSTSSFRPSVHHRRETSVPYTARPDLSTAASADAQFWPRARSSSTSVHYLSAAPATATGARSTTPDSSHSSTGVAEDYFTYISQTQQQPRPADIHTGGQETDVPIPEIRLAPPTAAGGTTTSQNQNDEEVVSIQVTPHEEEVTKPTSVMVKGIRVPVKFYIAVQEVWHTLFPTLQGWMDKTAFSRISSLVAVPVVLVFTLTLPVAEDVKVDDVEVVDDQPDKGYLAVPPANEDETSVDVMMEEEPPATVWCKWLLAVQAVVASTFVTGIMALNEFIAPVYIAVGFAVGCILAILVILYTDSEKQPHWYWMLSFAGFVIALNWIFLLANEMVGLLQALGTILNISDAIMGLTIFALGNSVGDLVANTAIAKMGFPTMAISACYAGPLLNMVLGVGISSAYQAFKTGHPYELDIAPSILVSCSGLITVLLSTLVVVNLNGYVINKGLGWWMIIVYSTCCLINVLLECDVFKR